MNARTGIALGLFVMGLSGVYLAQSYWRDPAWTIREWRQGDQEMPRPSHLVQKSESVSLGQKKIRWASQVVAGIEIENSYVKTVEQNGEVVFARGRFLEPQRLPTEQAVNNLLAKVDALKLNKRIELATKDCPRPIDTQAVMRYSYGQWRLLYKSKCETLDGTVELAFNAKGAVMDRQQIAAQFGWENPQVVIYPRGPRLSGLTAIRMAVSDQPFYLLTPSLEVRSDAGLTIADLGELSSTQPEDPRFDMVQAYYFTTEALKWTEQNLGTRIQGLKLRTHVGHPEKRNVAFYHSKEIRIGAGDDVVFSKMAWDPTIVVHEAMHSVVEALTHLPFQGEGGSLSEALADSLTALHLQTPNMGEASYREGPYQRTLTDQVLFSEKAGKLYRDSLILSGAVWQVREDAGDAAALDLVMHLLQHLGPSSGLDNAREHVQTWFQSCSEGELCDRIGRTLTRRGWL